MNKLTQIDTLKEKIQQQAKLLDQLKKAISIALLISLGAQQAKTQTISISTIPPNKHSYVMAHVQESTLKGKNMSAQEFKEKIIKPDLRNLDSLLHFSDLTSNIEQQVFQLLNDTVYVIPDDQLPPITNFGSTFPSSALVAEGISTPNDGIYDEYIELNNCYDPHINILYALTSPDTFSLSNIEFGAGGISSEGLSKSTGYIVLPSWITPRSIRPHYLAHLVGHTVPDSHGNPSGHQEGVDRDQIEVITNGVRDWRVDMLGFFPGSENALKGSKTIMSPGSHQDRTSIFSSRMVHPGSNADVGERMVQDIIDSPQLLEARIQISGDIIINTPVEFSPLVNRDKTDGYQYTWTIRRGDEILLEKPGESVVFVPQELGPLTIEMTAINDCGTQTATDQREINVTDMISHTVDQQTPSTYTLTPNPVQGSMYISGEIQDIKQMTLYSISGNQLTTLPPESEIDMQSYASGPYILRIMTKHGTVSTHKIIKL